jgi:hypothetical protein
MRFCGDSFYLIIVTLPKAYKNNTYVVNMATHEAETLRRVEGLENRKALLYREVDIVLSNHIRDIEMVKGIHDERLVPEGEKMQFRTYGQVTLDRSEKPAIVYVQIGLIEPVARCLDRAYNASRFHCAREELTDIVVKILRDKKGLVYKGHNFGYVRGEMPLHEDQSLVLDRQDRGG